MFDRGDLDGNHIEYPGLTLEGESAVNALEIIASAAVQVPVVPMFCAYTLFFGVFLGNALKRPNALTAPLSQDDVFGIVYRGLTSLRYFYSMGYCPGYTAVAGLYDRVMAKVACDLFFIPWFLISWLLQYRARSRAARANRAISDAIKKYSRGSPGASS